MRHLRIILLLSIFLSIYICANGQDSTQNIEALLELIEEDEERVQLADRLQALASHPVDINLASAEEFKQIPFFDDFFIRNLLLYRSKGNGFSSIYDLKLVQGAPVSVLPLLEPFITISFRDKTPRARTHSFFVGSEIALSRSPGSTPSLMMNYESVGKTSWHLSLENDRREPFLPLKDGFVDYRSIAIYGDEKLDKLMLSYVLGDYRVNTGQGLLLGQSFSYFSALSAGTGIPTLSSKPLCPHRSFRENGFLRGASVVLGRPKGIRLMLFGGFEPLDARVEQGRIVTLYPNSLHRTKKEREYRHTTRRESVGGYLSYSDDWFHVGISTIRYRYKSEGITLLPPSRYPQQKAIQQWAVDASYTGKNWQAFVESILASKERLGIQGGLRYFEDHFGSLTLQGRYFGKGQISPYGVADTYTSTSRDEAGIRLMWNGEVGYWMTGTILIDHFEKLSTKDKSNTIVQARVMYNKSNTNIQGTLRFHHREGGDDRLSTRVTMKKELSARISLRGGGQLTYTKGNPFGYTVFSRLTLGQHSSMRGEFEAQYFNHKTGFFRADLPYVPNHYYNPSLRGVGLQLSASMRYIISQQVELGARINHTLYSPKALKPTHPNPSLLNLYLSIKV